MCRFVLYLGKEITVGSLVTSPVHSIIRQSFQSREQEKPINGDGFGLAWYVPEIGEEPASFKEITPAWNNSNLLNLARVTRSSCVLAHVRAATPGFPVVRLNCHPFVNGPYAFMHNGRVEGFNQFKRKLLAGLSDQAYQMIQGSTDSEHAFALFMDQIWQINGETDLTQRMISAMDYTIRYLEEMRMECGERKPSFLNFAVTNGSSAVATRYVSPNSVLPNSLYYSQGSRIECCDGIFRVEIEPGTSNQAAIVASEPLSEENCWISVDPNHRVVISPQLDLQITPID
jgi:predicted glutamine amidotransferase